MINFLACCFCMLLGLGLSSALYLRVSQGYTLEKVKMLTTAKLIRTVIGKRKNVKAYPQLPSIGPPKTAQRVKASQINHNNRVLTKEPAPPTVSESSKLPMIRTDFVNVRTGSVATFKMPSISESHCPLQGRNVDLCHGHHGRKG